MNVADSYLQSLAAALNAVSRPEVEAVIDALMAAHGAGRRVYLFGNGGSAATASHMANDLNKQCSLNGSRRFRAICLNDNVPTMMAWANDQNYADVLVEQLDNHLDAGDVVVLISTSGTSPNVVRGAGFARERGATVVGLTGPGGGDLARLAHLCVYVPTEDIGQQEDVHLVLNHTFGAAIRARLQQG